MCYTGYIKLVRNKMSEELKKTILHDKQIIKFSFYGFFKNLRFFEPYLWLYFINNGLSLLQIGVLLSIQEIIVNLFEIPSGVIADYWGRKKELAMCFVFYIVSFVLFCYSKNFIIAVIAIAFFGLGEAFRSGTHKSMIYSYLEHKDWQNYKSFVYGKTRSSSLIGSAISSFIAIVIILYAPKIEYIFLVSIIPYLLDFFLILSYPNYIDKNEGAKSITLKEQLIFTKNSLLERKSLRHILLAEGIFEGIISSIKDYIQPILEGIILGGVIIFSKLSLEDNLHIVLGLVYMIINIFGSVASRKAYHLKKFSNSVNLLNIFSLILVFLLAFMSLEIQEVYLVIGIFLLIKILQNIRKPIYIDKIDDYMNKCERATILSIASQLKSLVIIVISPLAGFVADNYGINYMLLILALLIIIFYPFTKLKLNFASKK